MASSSFPIGVERASGDEETAADHDEGGRPETGDRTTTRGLGSKGSGTGRTVGGACRGLAVRRPGRGRLHVRLLPEHICENEAEEEEWRAELCVFIREHVEADEVYRLGRADLEFGDLLPDKPGSLKQKEYEEQTQLAFSEERLAKKL